MVTRANTPGKYKDFLEDCYEVIKNQDITSFNFTKKMGLSLCINFLEIPMEQADIVAITVSVMEDRKKKARLNAIDFARVCAEIENLLLSLSAENNHSSSEIPYWIPLVSYLLDGWYKKLKCHRLFFIPKELLPQVIMGFTQNYFVSTLKLVGNLKEVSYYVNTNKHHIKLVNLSDKTK